MNTLSDKEVKDIAAAAAKEGIPGDATFNARNAARSRVHEALQARNPMPLNDFPPAMVAARERRTPRTYTEAAEHRAHQMAQLTEEHHEAYGKARASGSPDAIGVQDAHYFVQKMHGKSLWQETDRLVDAVLGKVAS